MSDIFRDVDEALQRERAEKFWKEYGPTLVLAILLLIAATAVTTAYRAWDNWRDGQETAKLVAASENPKGMAEALEAAAKDTRDGHEAVALMMSAAQYAQAKDFKKAAELYGKVANGTGQDGLPGLARIYEVRSLMAAGPLSDAELKDRAAKLEKIAADEKSPFQLMAKLDAATLLGDGMKDYAKAVSLLDGFDGKEVPESLKEKAAALKHVYTLEGGVPAKETGAAK